MEQNRKSKSVETGDVDSAQLVETLFAKLKELGADGESSRLFPNGLESVNLEISTGEEQKQGFRLTLKAAGTQTQQAIAVTKDDVVVDESDDDFEVSFNAEGHHVIATIARMDLEANSTGIRAKLQKILDDGDRTLLKAATFPDDIRMQHPETKPFHFVDIPLQQGGPANPPLPHTPHVISKIKDFSDTLKNGTGSASDKVDALSWLIHLFGDIHQPLHCVERINELHPAGDRGGNSFKLKGKAKNLHSAWDSSVNVLNPGKDEEVLAAEIIQEHSRNELHTELAVTDTEKWARASFKIAKQHAYAPLVENASNPPKLSAAYLKNMEKIGRRQAALAGYRLADKLKEILK